MALPVKQAASLASEMAKKGLMGSISMGEKPKEDGMDEMDDMPEMDDHEMVMQDIDKMVPGLAPLIQELVERCMAKKEEPEEEME